MLFERRSFLKFLPAMSGLSFFNLPENNPKAGKIALRFIVASDGHFGQPNTDYKKFHSDLIGWINQEKVQKGVDFTVINGDLIHDDPTLMYDLKSTFENLRVPFYVTRGNHDKVGLDVWQSTWGYPTNHSFGKGEYAFILGDTSNEKGEYLCPDINWLRTEIAKYSTAKGIYIFLHITPEKWTDNGVNCKEVTDLFANTPNVKAIFHGHDHDQDSQKTLGKKPYFFDGHFGGNWGTTYKGYRVVEIYDDETWQTYQYNPTASPVLNSFNGKK
ncbi:metallophosphoesterase [Dyadobacter sp. CY345]|uniref:metallophosphoesterase family protein n=1 Tax=Dyadobacter sp. CY345 TaxID=2909335 RepID=UPI001F280260|nr:metallophosphoesterase [Dyadobacter sp. CY345]MCF2446345.1 metallophosphoesterase [Dyadobacter sp. CY345]